MDFDFIRQGTRYGVHTEVGNGVARVQVNAAPADDVADAPTRGELLRERRQRDPRRVSFCRECMRSGYHAQRCPESES